MKIWYFHAPGEDNREQDFVAPDQKYKKFKFDLVTFAVASIYTPNYKYKTIDGGDTVCAPKIYVKDSHPYSAYLVSFCTNTV